jgi:hypothetical protein
MAEPTGKCPDREKLLWAWTDSSNRLTRVLDEQLAAIRNGDQTFASFAERIRLAKNAKI